MMLRGFHVFFEAPSMERSGCSTISVRVRARGLGRSQGHWPGAPGCGSEFSGWKKYAGIVWLVVWLPPFFIFPYIGFLIIPIDELIFFQRGGPGPPTSFVGMKWYELMFFFSSDIFLVSTYDS